MISGQYEDRLGGVAQLLEAHIATDRQLGAALSVWMDGRPVLDLWGGHQDTGRRRPWARDTLVCAMSINKALAALCVHLLGQEGLDLEAPVAAVWPEFAAAGKADISLLELLGHQAGLVFTDMAPPGALFDQPLMAAALAASPPAPGLLRRGAYHTSTYGVLIGEVVRRVSGQVIGDFFRDRIAGPHGVDYHFAPPAEEDARTSAIHVDAQNATVQLIRDRSSPVGRAWAAAPNVTDLYNDLSIRRAGFASGSGVGNARALAKLFNRLLTAPDQQDPAPSLHRLPALRRLRWEGCALSGRPYRMAGGFFLNSPGAMPMGPNPNAFGHAGAGGALAFCDPDLGLSLAFTPNRMASGGGVGETCEALVDELYRAI